MEKIAVKQAIFGPQFGPRLQIAKTSASKDTSSPTKFTGSKFPHLNTKSASYSPKQTSLQNFWPSSKSPQTTVHGGYAH